MDVAWGVPNVWSTMGMFYEVLKSNNKENICTHGNKCRILWYRTFRQWGTIITLPLDPFGLQCDALIMVML